MTISDGPTLPAGVDLLDAEPDLPERPVPIRFRKNVPTAWLRLVLREGRNRQVRRMTAAVGHPTLRLVRVASGPITLESLKPGEWCDLSADERKALGIPGPGAIGLRGRRAGVKVRELAQGLENYRAGQTGLLRLSWDNGDRTVLVNPELGGVTFGWHLVNTAQDELFAAIEGTAFHTRIILERMAEHGVRVERVINAGGIPQNNAVLNQIYANVLNKPVLVPAGTPTSLGSGIFALLAAGTFQDD